MSEQAERADKFWRCGMTAREKFKIGDRVKSSKGYSGKPFTGEVSGFGRTVRIYVIRDGTSWPTYFHMDFVELAKD